MISQPPKLCLRRKEKIMRRQIICRLRIVEFYYIIKEI